MQRRLNVFLWGPLKSKEQQIPKYIHKEEPSLRNYGEVKVNFSNLMEEPHILLEDWRLNDGELGCLDLFFGMFLFSRNQNPRLCKDENMIVAFPGKLLIWIPVGCFLVDLEMHGRVATRCDYMSQSNSFFVSVCHW